MARKIHPANFLPDPSRLGYELITERGRITPGELRCWLDLHNMKQADLAKALGLSTKTVNSWCTGRHGTPRGLHDVLVRHYGKPYPPNDWAMQ